MSESTLSGSKSVQFDQYNINFSSCGSEIIVLKLEESMEFIPYPNSLVTIFLQKDAMMNAHLLQICVQDGIKADIVKPKWIYCGMIVELLKIVVDIAKLLVDSRSIYKERYRKLYELIVKYSN
ncbi:hypothetical protein HDV01_004133 [Terramyces sp. JEL0728]|nr:hypothetical protein HDV01_004133 [Terramyces sp. JEL0728]